MKKLLTYILILTLFACEKETKLPEHKVTFLLKFISGPGTGSSNFIQVWMKPNNGDMPNIDRFNIPRSVKYEYSPVLQGDVVTFQVQGQLSYWYEMFVYIDDVEVSYMRARVSDYNYYSDHVEERRGLNDYANVDHSIIEFHVP